MVLEALAIFSGTSHPLMDFMPEYDRFIEKYTNDDARIFERGLTFHHPSGLEQPCLRQIIYSEIGAPKKGGISARIARIWENGHSTQGRLSRYTQIMGGNCLCMGQEIPVENKVLNLKGSIDEFIIYKDFPCLIDWKTMKQEDFKVLTFPSKKYQWQMQSYFLCDIEKAWRKTHKYSGPSPQYALVIYENKNTQEIKNFLIQPDPTIQQAIKDKCKALDAAQKAKVLPDRLCRGMTQMEADWCQYSHICFDPKETWAKVDRRPKKGKK